MNVNKNSLWYYLSMLPILVALISIILLTFISLFDLVEDRQLFIIIAFALAELTMILAGMGGITYLIDANRTSKSLRFMRLNAILFFLAAFSGLMLFMQI